MRALLRANRRVSMVTTKHGDYIRARNYIRRNSSEICTGSFLSRVENRTERAFARSFPTKAPRRLSPRSEERSRVKVFAETSTRVHWETEEEEAKKKEETPACRSYSHRRTMTHRVSHVWGINDDYPRRRRHRVTSDEILRRKTDRRYRRRRDGITTKMVRTYIIRRRSVKS